MTSVREVFIMGLDIGDFVKVAHHDALGVMQISAIRNDGVLCESRAEAENYHVEIFPLHWLEKVETDPSTGMWIPPKPEQDSGEM
jgi:hypothetical protein